MLFGEILERIVDKILSIIGSSLSEIIEWASREKILMLVYPIGGWIKRLKDYINYYKHLHAFIQL